jgi:hypothetical protein
MKQNYGKAVKTIIAFKKAFDDIDPKTPRKLVGELGEFYALQKLEKLGLRPERKGGQGGYDIYLKGINKRVEVRTSLWKNEGAYPPDKTIRFWGWRVEGRNQKKSEKFDYLVGVGLEDDFSKPKFYVFTYKEAFSVGDTMLGRFNNIKKKIHLFENRWTYRRAVKLKPAFVTPYERRINLNQSKFLNQWKKIK